VRVIAATNRNMKAMIDDGTFRGDLYYRLNVFTIELPSLRQRKEDIPDLVRYFIGCFKTEFGKESVELDPRIFDVMQAYDWPGNMRELQSVVKYALAHADGPSIRIPNLPDFILSREVSQAPSVGSLDQLVHELMQKHQGLLYEAAVQALESVLLPMVLAKTKGRLQEACDILGISRNTLKAKMKDHGISIDAQVLSKTDPRDQSLTAPH
jgi:two-component system nitrogen regulation response regulator GlnG